MVPEQQPLQQPAGQHDKQQQASNQPRLDPKRGQDEDIGKRDASKNDGQRQAILCGEIAGGQDDGRTRSTRVDAFEKTVSNPGSSVTDLTKAVRDRSV